MKKIFFAAICLMLVLAVTACGAQNNTPPADTDTTTPDASGETEMTLSQIMAQIVDGAGAPDLLAEQEITDENCQSFLFIQPIEGAEGLVSEAQINAIAHSVCLYRVPDTADAAAIAQEIQDNANPCKWVCVEAESTQVLQKDQLILLVMSTQDTADAIAANFNALQ